MELLMGSGQTESGGSSSNESSSLIGGLRFGQKIYFEDGSGSGSKNRVGTGRKTSSTTTARCQVEGCRMDLSNAKAYYLRHKVCCTHSKSSKVIVSGLPQRFCQQCSRFHQLSEFDLEKRSCRRRLACHNERRRKPQPAAILFTSRFSRIAPSLYGNANNVTSNSVLGDLMPWTTARSVMRRFGPWQIDSESEETHHQLMNVFSNGSSSFTICPQMVNNNSTDSSCALSLLSNSNPIQQSQRLQTSTNTWLPSSDFDSITNRVTMAQAPSISTHHQYLSQTCEFMAGEKSNSCYMSPVSHVSEPPDFQINNGTTMGGYELSLHQQVLRQYIEPKNTRSYDSSPQHFNWSL